MNSAIASRASVGVIGLAVADGFALNPTGNLRVALSEMWKQGEGSRGYIRTKFFDLATMGSSFVAILATLALSALAAAAPMGKVLGFLGYSQHPRAGRDPSRGVDADFIAAVVVGFHLDDRPIAQGTGQLRQRDRAALIAAIGFELFKLVGSIYLKYVLHSPAGATFGPVLGLMVFAYVTARLLLFATAWAARRRKTWLLSRRNRLSPRPLRPGFI